MKRLFDGSSGDEEPLIKDRDTAIRFIRDIEIPVCVNLGLCFLQTKRFHHAVNYLSQALDKEENNEKALYRRGVAYLKLGELLRAEIDLKKAHQITNG